METVPPQSPARAALVPAPWEIEWRLPDEGRHAASGVERRLDDLVERGKVLSHRGICWSLDFLPCNLMPQPKLMDPDRGLEWSSDTDAETAIGDDDADGEEDDEDDVDEPEPPKGALMAVVHPAEDLAPPAPCMALPHRTNSSC